MLTMGAMVILSLTMLRVNKSFVTSAASLDESKFSVLALSLASSVIEEAHSKAYDESTVEDAANTVDLFSSSLGPDNESYAEFDDCDDYNGYQKTISNIPSADFNIYCTVTYVNPSAPDVNAATKTWNKKITVMVTSPSMKDTVRVSSIFSYWYFR